MNIRRNNEKITWNWMINNKFKNSNIGRFFHENTTELLIVKALSSRALVPM